LGQEKNNIAAYESNTGIVKSLSGSNNLFTAGYHNAVFLCVAMEELMIAIVEES